MKTIVYIGAVLALLMLAVVAYAQDASTECFDPCKKGFKFVLEASKDGKKFYAADTFDTNENVWVWGYNVGGKADIFVTVDQDWSDGDEIEDVVAMKLNKDIDGKFLNMGKFEPGQYDVVVDRNRNGVYDKNCDAVDSSTILGFEVLPEAATLGLMGLGLASMAGYFFVRRK